MGFGAGIGYDHGRVGEHLQTIHIDGIETLPQRVVRWEEIGVEVAHHRRAEVFHELWIREVVRPGKVSEDDGWRVGRLRRQLLGSGGVVAGGGRCRRLIRHLGTRAEISGIRAAQLTTDVHRVVLRVIRGVIRRTDIRSNHVGRHGRVHHRELLEVLLERRCLRLVQKVAILVDVLRQVRRAWMPRGTRRRRRIIAVTQRAALDRQPGRRLRRRPVHLLRRPVRA